ncbi:type VI secretion system baseplate subunit TssE [Pseudoalteromonas sp. MMG005]|nr:type VI secretion system baseplate subunit TssE [Pseudoalteromonas sp. MMG005]
MDKDSTSNNTTDELVQSIHHNIGLILKTEAAFLPDDKDNLTSESNICFGLEDIALFSRLNSGEQIAIRIKNKISQFEPRLHGVKAIYIENEQQDLLSNTMKFEISAMLTVNGKEEILQFDTDINLSQMTVLIENESQYD